MYSDQGSFNFSDDDSQSNIFCQSQRFDSQGTTSPSASNSLPESQDTRSRKLTSWVFRNGWADSRQSDDGKGRVIKCLFRGCGAEYQSQGGSTSNIINHLARRHLVEPADVNDDCSMPRKGQLDIMFNKGKKRLVDRVTIEDVHKGILKLIVREKLPLSFVSSPSFQEVIDTARELPSNIRYKLPSNDSTTNLLKETHDDYEDMIRGLLSGVPKLAFTVDGWTSPYQDCFMCVTAHWISDSWELKEVILGFEPITGKHEGSELMKIFVAVLERFDLQRKVFSITSDNASNMKRMGDCFSILTYRKKDEWSYFPAKSQHIPCMAHVINLAVQEILGKNGLKSGVPNEQLAFDTDGWGFVRTGFHQDDDDKEHLWAASPLTKLRDGIKKIRASSQRKEEFEKRCGDRPDDKRVLILDVKTRWNSTFFMIERAFELRGVYKSVCSGSSVLTNYNLHQAEWNYLETLKDFLRPFAEITSKVSASVNNTTIQLTIPAYNRLLDEFFKYTNDSVDIEISHAAAAGLTKFRKYYAQTKNTHVYDIAVALHPKLRFRWWEVEEFSHEEIAEFKRRVRKVWCEDYKHSNSDDDDDDSDSDDNDDDDDDGDDDDDDLLRMPPTQKQDELEEYVRSWSNTKKDPLVFWRVNEQRWPNLARMAKDYLAIPATSTPSERCFSQARGLLPSTRNRLSKERIRELILVASWNKLLE